MPAESINTFDLAELLIAPLDETLPGADKMNRAFDGFEGRNCAYAYWGEQTGIAYDPEQIAEDDLPQGLDDLQAYWATRPGELGFNYTNGGSGLTFIRSVARNLATAIDFSSGKVSGEKLAALAPVWSWFLASPAAYVITTSDADSLTRLSSGEFAMVPAWEDNLLNIRRRAKWTVTFDSTFPIGDDGPGQLQRGLAQRTAPGRRTCVHSLDQFVANAAPAQ